MISNQDRYRGAMLGVLCGDALGAPYETWPGVAIRMDVERRGGLFLFDYDDPFEKDGRFPAGRPTDDSEMTAALAEHLIEGGDKADLYQRFRRLVVDKQSCLCDLPAYGFGGTTRKALAPLEYHDSLEVLRTMTHIPSNGALMRAAPLALRFHGRKKRMGLVEAAIRQAMITHRHDDAIRATVLYVLVLDRLLLGRPYQIALEETRGFYQEPGNETDAFSAAIALPATRPGMPFGFGGGAVHTLAVAHWATATSSSFEEGMEKAITIGRDVDTYGAVAGGLLGALYGVDAIPAKWREGLIGGERMLELADGLLEASKR